MMSNDEDAKKGEEVLNSQRNERAEENLADDHDAHEHEDSSDDRDAPKKTWIGQYMDDLTNAEPSTDYAPVVLPWRIGLFLFTSTVSQSLNYQLSSTLSNPHNDWTAKQVSQFGSLVYYVLYLGPVFGLIIDFVRIFRERFRPVIIIACIIAAVIGFVGFAAHQVPSQYGSCLMLCWLIQVVTMFMYIPMNAVVINYGNRVVESPGETSARIGSLMAQAMVWRTAGSLLYTIFRNFAYGNSMSPYVDNRWFCLIAAIISLVLVFQVIFLTKRAYYTDFRKVSLKNAEQVRFYRNALNMDKKAMSNKVEAPGLKFMFILCFTFIYFMLPDPLYNTMYDFNGAVGVYGFSLHLTQAISILGAIGALLGAFAYALWMYLAQRSEAAHGRLFRASPFLIVLAGTAAWEFGIFFHFFGEMGSDHPNFNYHVFIPFQTIVVQTMLRFAFMPSLSLAAMQTPRFFEASAFQLYSVSTSGGGLVSSSVTYSFMSSLGVSATSGYWKALLLFMVFRLVPLLIAGSLPKFREDETIPYVKGENEPMNDMDSDREGRDTQPIEMEDSHRRE